MSSHSQLLAYSLKTLDWASAIQLQRYFAQILPTMTDVSAVLLLCEHPTTRTRGRQLFRNHSETSPEVNSPSALINYCGRYGAEIVHSKGQLNCYFIAPNTLWNHNVFEYRNLLQSWMLQIASRENVVADFSTRDDVLVSRTGELGWLTGQIRKGVSQFGWTLNVDSSGQIEQTFSNKQQMTNWIDGLQVSSMSRELCKPIRCSSVREAAISTLMEVGDFDTCQFHTTHPYLTRQTQTAITHQLASRK